MSDLRTLLHETAPSTQPTSSTIADTQLAHARAAVRRRNARRVTVGSSLVAAAAVSVLAVGGHSSPTAPVANPGSTTTTTTASSVELVAYDGAQPTGYTLDRVPAGWQIDQDDLSILTLAPIGAAPTTGGPEGAVSLEGRIAIATQTGARIPPDVQLDDVRVGGRPGVIAHMDGGGDTRTLFLKQTSETYLEIQVWSGLGWDNNQIAAFASSVHINSNALPFGPG